MNTSVLIRQVMLVGSLVYVTAFAQTVVSVNCAKTPVSDDLHAAIATANANSTASNLYTLNISGTCYANAGNTPGSFTITAPMTLQQDPTATTPAVLDGSALNSLSATNVLVNKAAVVNLISLIVQNGVGNVSNPLRYAGGITNTGNLNIIKSIIRDNQGSPTGTSGGIQNYGNISIQQSLVAYNTTPGYGGGLRDDGISTIITTSTFYKNVSSSSNGGAIAAASSGSLFIYQSTITRNSAFNGAGLSITQASLLNNISQSIIANNIATSGDARYNNFADISPNRDDASKLVTDADAAANLGIPIVNGVPTLADNGGPTPTLKLGSGSLGYNAISAGTSPSCPVAPYSSTNPAVFDQRGAPRPGVGKAGCDVGAYETGQPKIKLITPSSGLLAFSVDSTTSQEPTTIAEVQNVGNDDLSVTSASISPLLSKFGLLLSPAFPLTLKAQAVQDFTVQYKPTINTYGTPDSSVLNIASNDTQNSSLVVGLQGTASGFSNPPIQQIQTILNLLTQDYPTKLAGEGKGNSAPNRFNAFKHMIVSAGNSINQNDIANACSQLKDAAIKVNVPQNTTNNNFFVGGGTSGTDASLLYGYITTLTKSLGCSL